MPREKRANTPARRTYLTYGGTVVAGGFLAGCTSEQTVHQVGVTADHGSRVGLAVARDDR